MRKIITLFVALATTLVVSETIQAQAVTTITCTQAREYALSVTGNNVEYNGGALYAVEAYVTSIQTAWNSTYHNITFWMADTEGGGNVIEAYRCSAETEADAPKVGDRVRVTGKLTKFGSTPEFASGCTCEILTSGEAPKNLGNKTIEQFLALKNAKDTCILTGVVDNIVMDNTDPTLYNQYGNFDLVEIGNSNVKVYIYGLLTPDKQSKQFRTLNVDAGDTLVIKAIYAEYNGNPQVQNAIYITHMDKVTPIDPTKTEVDFATDFAGGWTPWIGKTLTFLNDFYVHVTTPEVKAAYMRLRSPEEYGEENTSAYTAAVAANQNAEFTLTGVSFNTSQAVFRPGTRISGLTATVVGANQLQAVSQPDIIYNELPTERPDLGNANVVICGANLENFFVTLGGYAGASTEERLSRQKIKISNGLYHMNADIYALCEVEQGDRAASVLVSLLNELAGEDRYDWVNAGFDYADAIMVCYIYRKDKVAPVGSYMTPYSYTNNAYHYREAIQCFKHLATGEKFNLSLNHFKAKDSSSDTGDGTRQNNMRQVTYYLDDAAVNDPDILVMGDLNAYTNEESNLILSRDEHYTDLLMQYDPSGYSYVYDNLVGYLDHAYANASMAAQVTKAVSYHLNADTDEWNYCYKSYDTSMYRYADHDPILVGLRLGNEDPTGTSEIQTGEKTAVKVIKDGQVMIIRGGVTYTITGQRLY